MYKRSLGQPPQLELLWLPRAKSALKHTIITIEWVELEDHLLGPQRPPNFNPLPQAVLPTHVDQGVDEFMSHPIHKIN